jgi:hypothetical protein
MSYKDQRKELGIGSTGDMQSTQDGSKWHHGVDAAGIAKLTRISTEITDTFDKAARDFARTQINLGRLLNEARAIIPGDQQFGQWREKNTPINNKSTANKLMNLAKQVGDGRITQEMVNELPLSTLKELISAPDTVLVHVRDKLREGEPVGRQEVRELSKVSGDVAPDSDSDPERFSVDAPEKEAQPRAEIKQAPAPKAPGQPPARINPAQVVEGILALEAVDRLRLLDPMKKPPYDGCKPEEWAWLVFGLDPMPAYNPNWFAVESLCDRYSDLFDNGGAPDAERLKEILNKAFGIIEAQY